LTNLRLVIIVIASYFIAQTCGNKEGFRACNLFGYAFLGILSAIFEIRNNLLTEIGKFSVISGFADLWRHFVKVSQLYRGFGGPGLKEDLPSCSVLTQTASMRHEIDCKMPCNYS
jgi:hypothetical protein